MYKLEMHCHSQEVSACSKCSATELIARYKAAGYAGIVSTNHINRGTYQKMEDSPWKEKAYHFIQGYEALKNAAANQDFDVLLGCEINLTPVSQLSKDLINQGWNEYIPNDYLVYGMTEEWLYNAGDVRYMTMEELSQSVHEAGFLLVHAHPFRCGTIVMNPDLYDGYEVFNGNPRQQSHNELADAWAEMNHKIKTSGTDFHWPEDPPCGGIVTEKRIRDNETLLRVLLNGDYKLLCG